MRIAITGAEGQLGRELIKQLKEGKCAAGQVPFQYRNSEILALDLPDWNMLKDADCLNLQQWEADIIFHCAAFTDVEAAQDDADKALLVNGVGTRKVAIAAQKGGSKLIYMSTDYVFSGEKRSPYEEWDIPCPKSNYGFSKLMGETYAAQFCTRCFTVRTAWLYGQNGKNFVNTIIGRARKGQSLMVVSDQIGSPTNAEDVAYALLTIAVTEDYGMYHCTNAGQASWYTFAEKIIELTGLDAEVKSCLAKEYPSKVPRPAYSVLENRMLRCVHGIEMRGWETALGSLLCKEMT